MLGDSAKQRASKLPPFQQLMGDTRDLDMLRTDLEKWASKKGNKVAIVPALQRPQEEKDKPPEENYRVVS